VPPPRPADVLPHVCICICTYKRSEGLTRLLSALSHQFTGGFFAYSIVVVDNDHSETARPVTERFCATSKVPIHYCVEPTQNIPLARNKAVSAAEGDFVALIDDDELPPQNWLLTLFRVCEKFGVDGVLGPVISRFEVEPPPWVSKSGLYNRRRFPTGTRVCWSDGRTGNAFLRRAVFAREGQPFRPQFRTGEDQDFFRRMIEKGHSFIWCDEAVAWELIPPARWNRKIMLRRALLRGAVTPSYPDFGARDVAKSLLAVSAYTLALPGVLVLGQHKFMSVLVRLFHHLGTLLAVTGIDPVKEPYVTEQ